MVLVVLVMLHAWLYACSTQAQEKSQAVDEYVALYKELFTEPIYFKGRLDHVAEMQKFANKSGELATKAAKAAVFAARGIYATEPAERGTLMEPLKKVFERSADFTGGIGLDNWRSAFERLDAEVRWFMKGVQDRLRILYHYLPTAVSVPSWESSANDSVNTLLIGHYTTSDQMDWALCILQVFGSIFGSNCSIDYSSSCEDSLWDAPICHNGHVWRRTCLQRLLPLSLPNSRGGANEAYKRTARDIVDELKSTWFNHEFPALVYSSYNGPEKSDIVLYDGSEEDCVKETARLFTAYVKRYTPEDGDRVQELWKSVREDPYALAGLFDDAEPSVNMTERFRKANLYAKIFDEGGFRAAAVIPCAYRFVWYELAWQYFHVYGTTSPYALTFKGENEYKPCGVVVLFP